MTFIVQYITVNGENLEKKNEKAALNISCLTLKITAPKF